MASPVALPKPASMQILADNIPARLKEERRWVSWRWTWKGKKWDKPPFNSRTGQLAKSNDDSTWNTFDEAIAAKGYDGIGFMLGVSGDVTFSGLDLDDSVTAGVASVEAIYLASMLDSYAELSPSGQGVKVFTIGKLPDGRKKDDARGIEFYDAGRYFTVTGHRFDWANTDVQSREQELSHLHQMIFPPPRTHKVELTDKELALSALDGISRDRSVGYNDWLLVGMALHAVSPDLLDAWERWSQNCPDKYVAGDCDKRWRSFKRTGVGLGSLIYWAKENGWKYPEVDDEDPAGTHRGNGQMPAPSDNGHVVISGDPHMGDGLTEADGAGEWHLKIEKSNPKRYWLKSPIWSHVKEYILLSTRQIHSWTQIRVEAAEQTGVYVRPEVRGKGKKPVWDSRKGPRLLKFLLDNAEIVDSSVDFDRIRATLEYIIEVCETGCIIGPNARDELLRATYAQLDDGALVFKASGIAAVARREKYPVDFGDIKEAATRYAEDYRPNVKGTRLRFWKIEKAKLDQLKEDVL